MTNTSFIATLVQQSLPGGNLKISSNSASANSKPDEDIEFLEMTRQEFPVVETVPLNSTDEPGKSKCAFYVASEKIILSQKAKAIHFPFAARAISCKSNQGS